MVGKILIHSNNICRENKILQKTNENYLKEQKDGLKSIDPRLTLAEQRLEAMYQELVSKGITVPTSKPYDCQSVGSIPPLKIHIFTLTLE